MYNRDAIGSQIVKCDIGSRIDDALLKKRCRKMLNFPFVTQWQMAAFCQF